MACPEGSVRRSRWPTCILRYVARMRADTNMYGSSFYEAGLVDQWIEFAKNELDLPVGMWIYPILGFIKSNAANEAKVRTPTPPSPYAIWATGPCRAAGRRAWRR